MVFKQLLRKAKQSFDVNLLSLSIIKLICKDYQVYNCIIISITQACARKVVHASWKLFNFFFKVKHSLNDPIRKIKSEISEIFLVNESKSLLFKQIYLMHSLSVNYGLIKEKKLVVSVVYIC